MSQLAFAAEAISARHLCFLETGRAKPSREMVNLLATVLDLGLGDRNAMLLAAGFAPVYGEHDLDARELEPVRHAFEFVFGRLARGTLYCPKSSRSSSRRPTPA